MGYTLDNGNIGYFFLTIKISIIEEIVLINIMIS